MKFQTVKFRLYYFQHVLHKKNALYWTYETYKSIPYKNANIGGTITIPDYEGAGSLSSGYRHPY